MKGETVDQKDLSLEEHFWEKYFASWVNNREAGGLGGHRSHYDVTVMCARNLYTMKLRIYGHPDKNHTTTQN